jgi:O-antigen/teichoic acid export membrane protein
VLDTPQATGDVLDTPQAGPRALRGGALRTAGYVVGILLSLVAVPLLIGHLGIASYGRYVTIVSLTTIVGGLTEGGLNAIALREYTTSTGAERDRLMRDALGIRLVLTTLGAAVAVAFAALAGYGSQLVLGTALAGVGLLLQLIQSLLAVSLQGQLRFGWASTTDLLRQLVSVVLLVVLVLAGAGIVLLLGVAIPASLASLLVTAVLVRRQMPLWPAFAVRQWWPLIRDSIPWAAVSALNVVYFRLAIVIMSVLASAKETGYFATAFRVVEILIGVPAIAVAAAYPILTRSARDDRDRFAYATGRMFELALVVGGWMVVCLEVGAAFAIHVLAANQADPAIPVLRILGAAVVATFVSVACGVPLLTLRRYRDALLANAFALVVSVALTLSLVGPLGADGAAIAALSAEVALAAIIVACLLRASPQTSLPLFSVPVVALAAVVSAGIGLALPVNAVIGALAASVAYFAILRILGRFPPEVREVLAQRIPARFR